MLFLSLKPGQLRTPPLISPFSTPGVTGGDSVVLSLRHQKLFRTRAGESQSKPDSGGFRSTGSVEVGHTTVTTRCRVQVAVQVGV